MSEEKVPFGSDPLKTGPDAVVDQFNIPPAPDCARDLMFKLQLLAARRGELIVQHMCLHDIMQFDRDHEVEDLRKRIDALTLENKAYREGNENLKAQVAEAKKAAPKEDEGVISHELLEAYKDVFGVANNVANPVTPTTQNVFYERISMLREACEAVFKLLHVAVDEK